MLKEFFIEVLGYLLFVVFSIVLAPLLIITARIWWWLAKNAWSIPI